MEPNTPKSLLCWCGHPAPAHPAVRSIFNDFTTGCTVEGCECRDWDGPEVVTPEDEDESYTMSWAAG